MFGYDSHDDDFGLNRRNWAEKSNAATEREERAKAAFEQARVIMEARDDLQPGDRETVELLKPSCHLTNACWVTFRKLVISYPGWATKRRVATEEEKKQHGEKRKGKVYFTDVIYSVPKSSESRRNANNDPYPIVGDRGESIRSTNKRGYGELQPDLSEDDEFVGGHIPVLKKFMRS